MTAALLVDTTRCIGCNACSEACKEANQLPGEVENQLTAHTWTVLEDHDDIYVRRMCMHCEDPSCASVCPVGALHKTPEGPVAYEEERCIGCRYCMVACPFSVPKYEWEKALPRVQKCIGCIDRVREGKMTACAEACPAEATVFGDRAELLRAARKRIQENPDDYVHHIFGEREVGGMNVLVMASVPFAQLGFPADLPETEMPSYTWQALSKIPNVVSVGGISLLGLWWLINRRMTIERLEADAAAGEHGSVRHARAVGEDQGGQS
jgi:formate dehydrogenase iron-sulfur subunit